MFIVQAEEAFAPRLVPGRDRGQQLGQTPKSHTGDMLTAELLVAYLEFKLTWVSCTFSGSLAPERSFVTAFVK